MSTRTTPTAVSTFMTTPTSANLAAALSDETGSGSAVFGTRPTVTIQDSDLTIQDNGDNTKQAKFQASGITAGQTRTLTIADRDDTLLGLTGAAVGRLDFGMPPPLSGRYVTLMRILTSFAPGTTAMTADTLYGHPIWLRAGEVYSAASVDVTTFASSKSARIGLYAYVESTGMAGALIRDWGTVSVDTPNAIKDCTTGGNYTVTTTGWYVLAAVFDGTPTVRAAFSGGYWLGTSTVFFGSTAFAFSKAFTAGAGCSNTLPDPFGGSPAFLAANGPFLGLKVA